MNSQRYYLVLALSAAFVLSVIHTARALEGTTQYAPRPALIAPGVWKTPNASGSGTWSPQTIDSKRLLELEKMYTGNKNAAVLALQKQQMQELKAKREQVRANWKKCEEAILTYKKQRLIDRKALEVQGREALKACVPQTATATNSAEKRALHQEYLTCRRDSEAKNKELRNTFEKETRMRVLELQKACVLENQKPATNSAAVQGVMIQDDEIATDTTIFMN